MSIQVHVVRNALTPDLAKKVRAVSDPRPVLEAMALAVVSIAKRSFRESSMRGSVWAPKKDGKPSNLILTTSLSKSIRVAGIEKKVAKVASDRKYAAVHQLGSERKTGRGGGIPARPFLPFDKSGKLSEAAAKRVRSAAERALKVLLKTP